MKQDIHPDYHKLKIIMTDGSEYTTYSTYGNDGDVMRLDIDPKTHPAWIGGERKIMERGQQMKFEKRFAGFGAAGGGVAAAPAEKEAAKGKK
jgi:large subunit ribosomal protein L31